MRPRVPDATISEVLLRSRRRCAICFGLHRDAAMKQGQIAHLDHDRANNDPANLAFLCLAHHDQYDSRTSQSKNLTIGELRRFGDELSVALATSFARTTILPEGYLHPSNIEGHYVRLAPADSAEVTIESGSGQGVRVKGLALWGDPARGAHTGDLDFRALIQDGMLVHAASNPGGAYAMAIRFADAGATIVEDGWMGAFGMNVRFGGVYAKAG